MHCDGSRWPYRPPSRESLRLIDPARLDCLADRPHFPGTSRGALLLNDVWPSDKTFLVVHKVENEGNNGAGDSNIGPWCCHNNGVLAKGRRG